jgi:hypothetical protein
MCVVAAGATPLRHAVAARVIVLLGLVAALAGEIGVELRVVRGVAAGAIRVSRHTLFGQSVTVAVARNAGRGVGKIVRLVTIRARAVTRGKQMRARDHRLCLRVALGARRCGHDALRVVTLMTAVAGLLGGELACRMRGGDLLVATRTALGFGDLPMRLVTGLARRGGVHLDGG